MTDRVSHDPLSEEAAEALQELDDTYAIPDSAREIFGPEIDGPEIIVLPNAASRGDSVAFLSKDIEHNKFGLPTYFLRSDLLPSLASGAVTATELEAAMEGLYYHEGYPTLQDGTSFWSQLPHEPRESFLLFQRYVQQAETQGIRQLDILSTQEGTELIRLKQLYLEFYWSTRARAYDLFIVAANERKRQIRTRNMESSHFDQANALLTKLAEKFEDEDWLEELNAKEAIEALDTLVKIQRLSMGLTGNNASSIPKNVLPESASVEALMEHLTRGASMGDADTGAFEAKLRALMTGEDGMVVQEAILRLGRPDSLPVQSGASLGEEM